MIINGGSYRARGWWAQHLDNAATNDVVRTVHMAGLDGCETVASALRRMEEMALGTEASNFFGQYNINARPGETLSDAQARASAKQLMANLGMDGHPSMLIEHVKEGRQHFHLLVARVDAEGALVRDSFTARIFERTSRELEIAFELERGQSILEPDRDDERPARRPKKWETQRALRGGIPPEDVARDVTALQRQSDTGAAFRSALEERGYILLRGDKNVYCILDQAGDLHSLGRRVLLRAKELRAFMADVPLDQLPSAADARAQFVSRQERGRSRMPSAPDIASARRYAVLESALEQPLPIYDRDAETHAWQDGVDAAAIAADHAQAHAAAWADYRRDYLTQARSDVQEGQAHGREAWREARAAERAAAEAARRAAYVESRSAQIARDEDVRAIERAYAQTEKGAEFLRDLETRFMIARVTEHEAQRSQTHRQYLGRGAKFEPGDYVAINARGRVLPLDATTIHDDAARIVDRLAEIDASQQLTMSQAQQKVDWGRLEAQGAQTNRIHALTTAGKQRTGELVDAAASAGRGVLKIGGSAARVAATYLDDVAGSVADLFTGGGGKVQPVEVTQVEPVPPRGATPALAPPQHPERDALLRSLRRLQESAPSIEPDDWTPRRRR